VRVFTDSKDNVSCETFIPYCNMANAQLSFHGHRDAVKFFVSVPGNYSALFALNNLTFKGHGGLALNPTSSPVKAKTSSSDPSSEASSMLVMSGGEGYIDFRIGELNYA